MRKLISFATKEYALARRRLVKSAVNYFDEIVSLGPADLPQQFYDTYAEHFRYARGFGFWVWKPYIILNEALKSTPGDVVFYCDSQLVFCDDPARLFDLCLLRDGVLLFHQAREGHRNRAWTRRACFEVMGCCDEKYRDAHQTNSAMNLWAPTSFAISLLSEWLRWCGDLRAVSDGTPDEEEEPGFIAHRHDQSILGILAVKHHATMFPDPSQYGAGYEEKERGYGQVLSFDRFVPPPYEMPCYLKERR